MLHAGEAVDQTRKDLLAAGVELPKGALWALRGNEWNQADEQVALRRALMKKHDKIGRAISLRSALHDLYVTKGPDESEAELKWWCGWALRSRLEGFRKVARMAKAHWDAVLAFFSPKFTNAAMKATNGIIQLAKRRARGFRFFENLRTLA